MFQYFFNCPNIDELHLNMNGVPELLNGAIDQFNASLITNSHKYNNNWLFTVLPLNDKRTSNATQPNLLPHSQELPVISMSLSLIYCF